MHLQLCDLQSFLKASCNCFSCTLALLADSASSVFTVLSQQLWTTRRRRRFSGSGLGPDICSCCSILYLFMSHFHRGSAGGVLQPGVVTSGSGYVCLLCCYICVQRVACANFDCRTTSFQDIQLLRHASFVCAIFEILQKLCRTLKTAGVPKHTKYRLQCVALNHFSVFPFSLVTACRSYAWCFVSHLQLVKYWRFQIVGCVSCHPRAPEFDELGIIPRP